MVLKKEKMSRIDFFISIESFKSMIYMALRNSLIFCRKNIHTSDKMVTPVGQISYRSSDKLVTLVGQIS